MARKPTNAELIALVNQLRSELSAAHVQIEAAKAASTKVSPTIRAKDYAPQRGKTTRTTWLATLFDKRVAYGYREAACRRAAQLGSTDTFAVKNGPKGTFSVLRYEH